MTAPTVTPRAAAAGAWDAVVIGAGPAGSVTARELALAGRRTLLVDRTAFPRPKVCGGCLAPRGTAILDALGLAPVLAGGICITHARLLVGAAAYDLPPAGHRVIAREILDDRLVRAARDAGAALLWPASATVTDDGDVRLTTTSGDVVVRSRRVIAADGIGGRALREHADLRWRVRQGSLLGAATRALKAPVELPAGRVVMIAGRAGYLGLVRLADGDIDAALAARPSAVRSLGGPAGVARHLVTRARGDTTALDGATWKGTPLLTRRRRRRAAGAVFTCGDAGSYREPFTGEGMSWAIADAAALSALLVTRWDDADAALVHAWNHRAGVVRRRERGCAIVGAVVRRPILAHAGGILATRFAGAASRVAARLYQVPA